MNMMGNPWLHIPAADYEAHMDSPNVAQLSFLGSTFKEALEHHECITVANWGVQPVTVLNTLTVTLRGE